MHGRTDERFRAAFCNRGRSRISPRSRSFWQIDKNDVGILPQAVEDDLLAIGSDIERPHRRVLLSEMRKLARRFRRHIENPEVLSCWARALHVNETLSTGQESYALALSVHGDIRPLDPCAV